MTTTPLDNAKKRAAEANARAAATAEAWALANDAYQQNKAIPQTLANLTAAAEAAEKAAAEADAAGRELALLLLLNGSPAVLHDDAPAELAPAAAVPAPEAIATAPTTPPPAPAPEPEPEAAPEPEPLPLGLVSTRAELRELFPEGPPPVAVLAKIHEHGAPARVAPALLVALAQDEAREHSREAREAVRLGTAAKHGPRFDGAAARMKLAAAAAQHRAARDARKAPPAPPAPPAAPPAAPALPGEEPGGDGRGERRSGQQGTSAAAAAARDASPSAAAAAGQAGHRGRSAGGNHHGGHVIAPRGPAIAPAGTERAPAAAAPQNGV
jgi:hypothetical protein